jgi:PAS domain S-box-containing protein
MNVLIVDDIETNRKLLKALLEAEGVTIFSARDGVDALKVLEREKVDAVISDILMPRMDGYRLCAEMRKSEKFKTIPFIAYTSTYTSPSDEKTAMDFGADVFLRKPSPPTKIIEALHEAIKAAPQRRAVAIASPAAQDVMKQYNASLIAKLEHKNAELEMQTAAMLKVQDQLGLQREALEAAANAILITDSGGTIRWVNAAFTALTGYTAEDCLGENPRFLKSDEQDATFHASLWKTILDGRTWQGEITNRRKDGTLFIAEQTITPIRLNGGPITHFIGIMTDITSRKQLEAQFIGAQKMEVVGHLAGGVAHDFNNILGVIMGYSDLLMMKLPQADEELKGFIETIRSAAERASGLTRQLLIFSRKQKVQLVVLNINEVIKDLEKMLRRLIDEHIQLNIVPEQDVGRIKADSGYIGQVVMNLVVNARDAMPQGGLLTVSTSNITLDEAHARAHAGSVPGDYVMLGVADTGTGMTEEVKGRIFEAFFTTKPKGKGTGLGLATCQTIVQQAGGHIDVQTEIGRGTTFKIYFPRVDQPLAINTNRQAGPVPRGTETLLVVEDEPSLRLLARNVLQGQGYEVLTAANGQEGLHTVRDHKGPPIRLVITDVVMPVMGGVVMAEWLKSDNPDMKILFTSGYTDDAIAQQGVLEKGVEFLSKPYTPATLAGKVRGMLDAPQTQGPS